MMNANSTLGSLQSRPVAFDAHIERYRAFNLFAVFLQPLRLLAGIASENRESKEHEGQCQSVTHGCNIGGLG